MSLLFVFHCLAALCLFVYGMNCYVLVFNFRRHRQRALARFEKVRQNYQPGSDDDLPHVTIQLPVYNEHSVVGRVIQAACSLDWPQEKLDVQILDDSTDETTVIIKELVSHFQAQGIRLIHLHRTNREGFKAGALQEGLLAAKGDLIAVFDADFVPGPDFLRRTVPFFIDPTIGMVQARWSHLNENYALLTRIQAVAIDRHFGVEQAARCWGGYFLNFNGTAGLWRREAIIQAGGWQSDTLTEDLDLSYRAQLAGWKMEYLPDVEVPSEIPIDMSAFKGQQRRWAKGSIQTAIKLLPRVFAAELPFVVKFQALIHLTYYLIGPLMLTIALTSISLMTFEMNLWSLIPFTLGLTLLGLATAGPSTLFITAQRALYKNWQHRILRIPSLMILGMGLAVNNSRAVIEAFIGTTNHFVRTPKHNIVGDAEKSPTSHSPVPFDSVVVIEAFLAVCCTLGFIFSLQTGQYMASPFLLLYTLGFTSMVVLSVKEAWGPWQGRRGPATISDAQNRIQASELAYQEALSTLRPTS